MMTEAQAIGEALGVQFPIALDRRIEGAGKVGAHKTSMLQDLERGRPVEIDALVTAIQELGRLTHIATPTVDTVLALVRRLAIARGCYPA
jgi:2-dehydropantoate 2-reductase